MSIAVVLTGYGAIGVLAAFWHVHLRALAAARAAPVRDEGTLLDSVWTRPSFVAMTVFVIVGWPTVPIFHAGKFLARLAARLAVLRVGCPAGEPRPKVHLPQCDDRVKPERMLLRSLMQRSDLIGPVMKIVRPHHFSRSGHEEIYGAIVRLWRRGEACNPATVAEELRGNVFLEEVGGIDYLVSLEHEACDPEAAVRYARLVLRNARHRGVPPASPPLYRELIGSQIETPDAPVEAVETKDEPHDTEAEMALLGALVIENDLIDDVMDVIEPDAFYRPRNAAVFQAITELYAGMNACDLVTLKNELERQGKLEKVGGVDYLAQIVETVPSAANAVHYAQIVHQKSILRALLRMRDKIRNGVRESGDETQRILDRAQEMIYQTAAKRGKEEVVKVGDILKGTSQQITDIHDRKQRILGMSSGFHELDDLMSGLQKAQLYVIAGRPSMGKTSMAMRMIENVGLEQGKSVLFFSLGMASAQIAQQMLFSHCRVDSHKLRTGMLGEEEYQKLLLGAGSFHESPIFIDDSADLSDLEFRARARRYKAQFGVDLIVVDNLQKMHVIGAESRQQEISRISSSLKSLAKELEVPVIALAQLNRSPERREGKKPELSDLRESGAIEQHADIVMLLYREEYYNPDSEKKNVCEVRVAKNRTGPTDTVELAFIRQYTRFENLGLQGIP